MDLLERMDSVEKRIKVIEELLGEEGELAPTEVEQFLENRGDWLSKARSKKFQSKRVG